MKVSVWSVFIPCGGFRSWHTKLRIYIMFYTCPLSLNVRLNTCQSKKAECPVWSCFKAMSGYTFFISCTLAIFISLTSLFLANWSLRCMSVIRNMQITCFPLKAGWYEMKLQVGNTSGECFHMYDDHLITLKENKSCLKKKIPSLLAFFPPILVVCSAKLSLSRY